MNRFDIKKAASKTAKSLLPDFGSADEEFLEKYRVLLSGQYQKLDIPNSKHPAKKVADAVIEKGEDAQWEDLYQLESAIVELEPEDALRRRAWLVRNEYKTVATPDELKDYIASNPPAPDTSPLDQLRADTSKLQDELHWRYLVIWIFEEYRASMTKTVCRLAGAIVVAAYLIHYWISHLVPGSGNLNIPLILSILTAGLLGGLTSTLRRIQKAKLSDNADLDLAQMLQGSTGVYISPVLGAIFSFLLFLFFSAKLAEGGVFPRVSFDLLFAYGAVDLDGVDYAKLLVWAFIAGFAESFVPDKLTRLAADSESSPASKN